MAVADGGWRHLKLGDLLTDETLRAIEPVMNDIHDGTVGLSEGKKRLLELLEPLREDLTEKGVLPDYLAWYLAYIAGRGGGELGGLSMRGLR